MDNIKIQSIIITIPLVVLSQPSSMTKGNIGTKGIEFWQLMKVAEDFQTRTSSVNNVKGCEVTKHSTASKMSGTVLSRRRIQASILKCWNFCQHFVLGLSDMLLRSGRSYFMLNIDLQATNWNWKILISQLLSIKRQIVISKEPNTFLREYWA